MRYYTNVFRSRDTLFVREVENGKRRRFPVTYKPTLYRPTAQKSTLHAPDGTPVEPFNPGTMMDCYKHVQDMKNVPNYRIFGNTSYEYAYIYDEYSTHIDYKASDLVIVNLDIEVESRNGFADASSAANQVLSITIKSSSDGVFHVFSYQPFDEDAYNKEHTDSTIQYHQCEDEHDLFNQFLDLWEEWEPDIVTGWNVRLYDIPYIINRIARIMSSKTADRLSPWRIIRQSTVHIFQNTEVVYDVAGVSILDYLLIYRKNVLEPRESYRLDYIAEVELKERKLDYSEHGSLQDLYDNNFTKFISYNIHDVRLVDRIEAKRKLIELQLIVAYHAHVNYVDVLSQVRTWDTLICNHLMAKGVVVPQRADVDKNNQFTGAFVMKPVPGMYEWIASFDVQSLYPTIMRTLNMGMETKLTPRQMTAEMRRYQHFIDGNLMVADEDGKLNVNPDVISTAITDELIEHFQEHDVAVGANAVFYNREPKSFYSEMIEELFNNRLAYKKKLKEAKKALSVCKDDPVRKAELETEVSIYDLKQHATKIMLNSLYGAMGNEYFRFFDVKNAEAVTTTGQFIIQYIGRGIDSYLNKKLKLGPCANCKPVNPDSQIYKDFGPQCGCEHQPPAQRFVVYSDTDSVYVALKPIVDKYCSKDSTTAQKVEFVDQLCKNVIQKEIDRLFRLLTTRYLNGVGDYLLMNREVIGDKGIWTAKKRYLVNVRDKEGIRKDPAELKYMGVEIKKTTVPKFCRDAMEGAVRIVMEKDQEALFTYVQETREKFQQQKIENVSFPRGVNGLEKYGDAETTYIKGTPFHVKGVLTYNRLIDKHHLEGKYPKIKDGEKMKFFYMIMPNPLNVNAMAFLTVLPPELGLDKFIDWDTQWEKSFVEPLMLILNAIGWDTERRARLSFFD